MKKLFCSLLLILCFFSLPALSACKSTLEVEEPEIVSVESVALDHTTLALKVRESFLLKAEVSPANAADKTVSWSSSDASTASVSEDGTVLGVKEGECTIKVTTKDGKKTATCKVTVSARTVYENLAEYAKAERDRGVILVTTQCGAETLSDRYEIEKQSEGYSVNFTLERLSLFEEKDGVPVAPESYKKTLKGKIVCSADGNVIRREGDEIQISLKTLSLRGFDFRQENFESGGEEEGIFRGAVKDPSAFMGVGNASQMQVEAEIKEEKISRLTVLYQTEDGNVTITYDFA